MNRLKDYDKIRMSSKNDGEYYNGKESLSSCQTKRAPRSRSTRRGERLSRHRAIDDGKYLPNEYREARYEQFPQSGKIKMSKLHNFPASCTQTRYTVEVPEVEFLIEPLSSDQHPAE